MNASNPMRSLTPRQLCRQSLVGPSGGTLKPRQQRFPTRTSRPSSSSRPFTSTAPSRSLFQTNRRPLFPGDVDREAQRRAYYRRKANVAGAGLTATILATLIVIQASDIKLDTPRDDARSLFPPPPTSSPGASSSLSSSSSSSPTPSSEVPEEKKTEQIPTGTSTIPNFPKIITLPATDPPTGGGPNPARLTHEEEYQLVGLGIRTVSFLSIQVYVVGLYIAVSDIAALQERLVRQVDPVATALVPGERQKLRDMLLDPTKSDEVWNVVLRDPGIRTALRIVPTRKTDFMHLRDGWVRGITARTQRAAQKGDTECQDDAFGDAMGEFKRIFGGGGGVRKNLPKGETLLLGRDKTGKLTVWYLEEGKKLVEMGGLGDERISRLVWLGYLAGKTVASEGARKSVVDGVMEFVERPVGTVATQVV